MVRKKKDDVEETIEQPTEGATEVTAEEEVSVEAASADETAPAEAPSVVESIVEAAADAVETVAVAAGKAAATVVSALTSSGDGEAGKKHGKRAERVGVVSSDKMTKTVTVRVDRLVKHPTYRKYVKRRKKFMAHDELGAKIGDKVKIVETRPLSARKRWRVVEIIQKAEL